MISLTNCDLFTCVEQIAQQPSNDFLIERRKELFREVEQMKRELTKEVRIILLSSFLIVFIYALFVVVVFVVLCDSTRRPTSRR